MNDENGARHGSEYPTPAGLLSISATARASSSSCFRRRSCGPD